MIKELLFPLILIIILMSSCKVNQEQTSNPEQEADNLLREVQTLIDNGSWRNALVLIDSIHETYPDLKNQRNRAKNLSDSITYLEAQRTATYLDTLLPPLLDQVDKLIEQKFIYEKNDKYENNGRFVHRLLSTDKNTSRNFIQAYVRDDRMTIVKSYYYGNKPVIQNSVTLLAESEQIVFSGSNHHFTTQGHHEIMTLENEQALSFLNFISTHQESRIRVRGSGTDANSSWIYYLNEKEKNALADTYRLGWLMKDIKQIEEMLDVAKNQILNYEQKLK
jgi:hypothetical protein